MWSSFEYYSLLLSTKNQPSMCKSGCGNESIFEDFYPFKFREIFQINWYLLWVTLRRNWLSCWKRWPMNVISWKMNFHESMVVQKRGQRNIGILSVVGFITVHIYIIYIWFTTPTRSLIWVQYPVTATCILLQSFQWFLCGKNILYIDENRHTLHINLENLGVWLGTVDHVWNDILKFHSHIGIFRGN